MPPNTIKLLERGLKFYPTPRFNNTEQRQQDVNEFCRALKLKEYFHGKDGRSDASLVKNESDFEPDACRNKSLNSIIDVIKLQANSTTSNLQKKNIKRNEFETITELKNNYALTIKEADKGSAIIVMNSSCYRNKILDLLNKGDAYKEIEKNMDLTVINKIEKFAKKYMTELTTKEKSYIYKFDYKSSQFYGLSKINKSTIINDVIDNSGDKEIISAVDPSELNLRPIVADPSCPTNRLSKLLDKILQPYQQFVSSYTKNNIQFLNNLPKTITNNEVFITYDVTSLYSNIRHDLGIEIISY